jgi:cyclophilin family peptidyl-prolyl cis-trans isomerase
MLTVRLLAMIALLVSATPATAEKRVALVIGNAAYRHVARLANPANDAKLVADTLREIGFTLIGNGAQLDLDKAGFERWVQAFSREVQGADVALFYYAGHGIQVRGSNYLVPVGANPDREADVDFQMLDVAVVLRQMEGSSTRLRLLILDACRNNPFASRGVRDVTRGLAQIEAPEGTLISYATQPGSVARDGDDGNSPYTRALAHTIRRAGLDVFQTFNEVGLVVKRATGGVQQPWVSSSPIDGRFYFVAPATLPPAATGRAADEIAWDFLKTTSDAAALRRFVTEFPTSARKPEADTRIAALDREERARGQAADEQHRRAEAEAKRAEDQRKPAPTEQRIKTAALLPSGADPENTIVIDTNQGRIVIKLRPDLAPKHAERIKTLAREKYYDNVPFHRVIDGFMAQTGDGQNKNGTGGSKYPNLPAEFSSAPFKRGVVGMARANDPNSANSQFFFMYADGSFLNGKYTVVGEVVAGMDVVDKIKKGEPVVNPDRMVRVQVGADVK